MRRPRRHRAHPFRRMNGQRQGDPTAHAVPEKIRTVDPRIVQNRDHVATGLGQP